jgi:hypothetical protein
VNALIAVPWADRGVADEALASSVTAPVARAITEIRSSFPDTQVYAWPDGQGGAHVVIDSIDLGPGWAQESTWLAFSISYLYPDADCYPHYVRADLAHADGRGLEVPFHFGNAFLDHPSVMVSRRTNLREPALSTAARKALSVTAHIQEQR